MMWTILSGITRAFDWLLKPFELLNPWVGLSVVSVVTGVVMLLIFGKTSNQRRIAETKEKLKAYIMEMWIFRNDTRAMFSAIGSVVVNNLRYLQHSLRPLVFIFVPVLLIMVQLGIRYANAPMKPGDVSIVSVELRDGVRPTESGVDLLPGVGYRILSPALRIDSSREIQWKVLAELPGRRELTFVTPEGIVTKEFVVQWRGRLGTVGAVRARAGSWDAFLYPSEPPLGRGSAVRAITLVYPARDLAFLRFNVNWLIAFFIISLAAGYALKGVFGIDV
jgi:hypothetical protein